MPLLSVLTAAIGRWAEFVAEAGDSVASQDVPEGWDVEWIVQEDGSDPCLASVCERFPMARYEANGEQLGTAVTRNIGLTRAQGSLVHVLDCDDLLLPGGLRTAIETFDAYPQIHWVAGQADDLLPGPTRLPFPPMIRPGYIQAGEINSMILDHGQTPVLCAGLTMRTNTVRALGGWVAVPRSDDLALLVAIAELTPGYLPDHATWLYRRHGEQTSRQSAWSSLQQPSLALIRQRIEAVRDSGIRVGTE